MEFDIEEILIKSFYEPTFKGMKFIYVKLIEEYVNDIIEYNNVSDKLREHNDINIGLMENFDCFSNILYCYHYFEMVYKIFINFKLKKQLNKKILNYFNNDLDDEDKLLPKVLQELMEEIISNKELLVFLNCQYITNNKKDFIKVINAICNKFDIENDYNLLNLLNGLETIYNCINYNIVCLNELVKILNEIKSNRKFKEKLCKKSNILKILNDELIGKFEKNDKKYLKNLLEINDDIDLFDLLNRFGINVNENKINNSKEVIGELGRIIEQIKVKIRDYETENILEMKIKNRVIDVSKCKIPLHIPNIKFLDCENGEGITNNMLIDLLENNRMWFVVKLYRHYYSIAVERINDNINFYIFDASSICFRFDYFYKVFGNIISNKNINVYYNEERLQIKCDCETWAIHFPFIIERLINFNYNDWLLSNLIIVYKKSGVNNSITNPITNPNKKEVFRFRDTNLFKQILMLDEHMSNDTKVNRVRNKFLYNYDNGTYITVDKRLVDLVEDKGLNYLSACLLNKTDYYNTSDYIYNLAINNVDWLSNFDYIKYLMYKFKYECLENIVVNDYVSLYLNSEFDICSLVKCLYENKLLLFDEMNEYFNIVFNILLNSKPFEYINLNVSFRNDFEKYVLDNLIVDNRYNLKYLYVLSNNNLISKKTIRDGYFIRYNSELEDDLKNYSLKSLKNVIECFDICEVRKYLLKKSIINNIINNIENGIDLIDIWYFINKLNNYPEGKVWLSNIDNVMNILDIKKLKLNVVEDFEILVNILLDIKHIEWLNDVQHIDWVLSSCKIKNSLELDKLVNILTNVNYLIQWFFNTNKINIIINNKTLLFEGIDDFNNFINILYELGYDDIWLNSNIYNIIVNSKFVFYHMYEFNKFLQKIKSFDCNMLYNFNVFNEIVKQFAIDTRNIKSDFKDFLNLLIKFGHEKAFIKNPENFINIINVSNYIYYQNRNIVIQNIFEALTEIWFNQKWLKEPESFIDIFINYKNKTKNIKHVTLFLSAILNRDIMKNYITHDMFIKIINCVRCNNEISLKDIWEFLQVLQNYEDTYVYFKKWILDDNNLNKIIDNFIDYNSVNNSCEYFYLILNELVKYGYGNIWNKEPNRFSNFFIKTFKFNNKFFINNYFSSCLLKFEFIKNWLLNKNNIELLINILNEKRFFEINYNYFYNNAMNNGLDRAVLLMSNLSVMFNIGYIIDNNIIENIIEKIEINSKHKDIDMSIIFQELPKCDVGLKWLDKNFDKIFDKYYKNNNFKIFSNFIINLSRNNLLNSKNFKNYITIYFINNDKKNECNIKETIVLLSNDIDNLIKKQLDINVMNEFKKIFDNKLNEIMSDKYVYASLNGALIESNYINNFKKVLLEIKK